MRRRYTLGLVAATSILLVGCGANVPEGAIDAEPMAAPEGSEDYDPVQPVGPGGTLNMDMGDFFFDVTGGQPLTGEVAVTVENVSNQYHNAQFVGAAEGSEIPEAEGGETGTGEVLLFPGEWTVYCNVPGHREAGMETTVTVYASEADYQAAVEAGDAPGVGGGAVDTEADALGDETDNTAEGADLAEDVTEQVDEGDGETGGDGEAESDG